MPFTYEYPRPAVTVDIVLFTVRGGELSVLLVRRGNPPFKGAWALPGGFVDPGESLEHAARRELEEETGVTGMPLHQLGAFGDPGRDPRGPTVSIAYTAFLNAPPRAVAGDDAADAQWLPLSILAVDGGRPKAAGRMAFDHLKILALARQRLREDLLDPTRRRRTDLVPTRFTMSELLHVHEVVLGRELDKRNFRAKLLQAKVVEPVSGRRTGRHRPAQLYRWAPLPQEKLDAPPSTAPRARRVR
jgi:8-oxo-dGTP diphosphatase